jgi:hypothetical protein
MSVGQLIRREDRKICFLRITTRVMRSPAPAHPTSLKTNPIMIAYDRPETMYVVSSLVIRCHRLHHYVSEHSCLFFS